MTLRTRLQRLEAAVKPTAAKEDCLTRFPEDDLMDHFAEWNREGHFDPEPDFPIALALFRDAVHTARADRSVPFDPPADFMPDLAAVPHERLRHWRTPARFPAVWDAHKWLVEMLHRLNDGIPPVSEMEYQKLACWFQDNEKRLYRLSLPSQLLDLGDGKQTTPANIRDGLRRGPRTLGAGKLAEELRRLQARYGDGVSTSQGIGQADSPAEC